VRLHIIPGQQLSRAVYLSGTYEPRTLRVLRGLLRHGDVFLDVGANVGVVSMAAARWVGESGRVYALEPSAREFDQLTAHVAANAAAVVTPLKLAVAAQSGTATLRVADAAHGGLNTLGTRFAYDVETARLEQVETTTLDEFVAATGILRVAVIKVDVEGGEGSVLAGAAALLRAHRPAVVMEVCARALAANGWSAARVDALLRDAGYVCYAIDDATGSLERVDTLTASDEQNVVALPAERTGLFIQ
jgi:FkbM family methyltransferase